MPPKAPDIGILSARAHLPGKEWAVEVDASIDALLATHTGYNNFHAGRPPRGALAGLVRDRREMPSGIEAKYLHALVDVYLGNDYGVSWAAESTYQRLLEDNAFVQNLRRGHYDIATEAPGTPRLRIAFDDLALTI